MKIWIILALLISSTKFIFCDVWTDSSKTNIVSGTSSLNSNLYIPLSANETTILSEVLSEYPEATAKEVAKEVYGRTTKLYWLEKAKEVQKEIDVYINLHDKYGFDVSASTAPLVTKIQKIKAKYDALP